MLVLHISQMSYLCCLTEDRMILKIMPIQVTASLFISTIYITIFCFYTHNINIQNCSNYMNCRSVHLMLIYFHLNSSGLWTGHSYGNSNNVVALHKDCPSVALLGQVGQMYERGIQLVMTSGYKVHITLRFLLLTNRKHSFHSILIQHNGTAYNLKKPLNLASSASQRMKYMQ